MTGLLVFTVIDDGKGFDPATTPKGTGLQGMADRLGALAAQSTSPPPPVTAPGSPAGYPPPPPESEAHRQMPGAQASVNHVNGIQRLADRVERCHLCPLKAVAPVQIRSGLLAK
jgi:hypothetical protein